MPYKNKQYDSSQCQFSYALVGAGAGAGAGVGGAPFCFLFAAFCRCFFTALSMLGTVPVGRWFRTASEKENIPRVSIVLVFLCKIQ